MITGKRFSCLRSAMCLAICLARRSLISSLRATSETRGVPFPSRRNGEACCVDSSNSTADWKRSGWVSCSQTHSYCRWKKHRSQFERLRPANNACHSHSRMPSGRRAPSTLTRLTIHDQVNRGGARPDSSTISQTPDNPMPFSWSGNRKAWRFRRVSPSLLSTSSARSPKYKVWSLPPSQSRIANIFAYFVQNRLIGEGSSPCSATISVRSLPHRTITPSVASSFAIQSWTSGSSHPVSCQTYSQGRPGASRCRTRAVASESFPLIGTMCLILRDPHKSRGGGLGAGSASRGDSETIDVFANRALFSLPPPRSHRGGWGWGVNQM